MLYTNGKLTAEDAALRRIARSKVRASLLSFETKSQRIVNSLIGNLRLDLNRNPTVAQLLALVEQHPQLQSEQNAISRYVDAFPELADTVSASRQRTEAHARRQLEAALLPLEYSHRFRFTKGLRC